MRSDPDPPASPETTPLSPKGRRPRGGAEAEGRGGAGRAAAPESQREPSPQASLLRSTAGTRGRGPGPVQPAIQRRRRVPIPVLLDLRRHSRWEALQRGRRVGARACSCVSGGVCAGAARVSACPGSIDQCGGMHIPQAVEEAGECWPSASGTGAWRIRRDSRGSSSPNPHPAARGLPGSSEAGS